MDQTLLLHVLTLTFVIDHLSGKGEGLIQIDLGIDCSLSTYHPYWIFSIHWFPLNEEERRETEIHLSPLKVSLEGADMHRHFGVTYLVRTHINKL